MSQIKRLWFALKVTIVNTVATVIYFRVVVDKLEPLVTGDFSGPLTSEAELAIWVVPIALGIIVLSTWVWVLISPQQQETKRAQLGRPPR